MNTHTGGTLHHAGTAQKALAALYKQASTAIALYSPSFFVMIAIY